MLNRYSEKKLAIWRLLSETIMETVQNSFPHWSKETAKRYASAWLIILDIAFFLELFLLKLFHLNATLLSDISRAAAYLIYSS